MLRVADREFQGADLHVDVLDLEHAGLVLVGGCDVRRDSETLAAEQDVRKTRVGELGEAALLLEVEGDIAHVRLDLTERQDEFMVLLIPGFEQSEH